MVTTLFSSLTSRAVHRWHSPRPFSMNITSKPGYKQPIVSSEAVRNGRDSGIDGQLHESVDRVALQRPESVGISFLRLVFQDIRVFAGYFKSLKISCRYPVH